MNKSNLPGSNCDFKSLLYYNSALTLQEKYIFLLNPTKIKVSN